MNSKTDVIVFCFAILTGFSAVDARAVPADPATGPGGAYSCEQVLIQGLAEQHGTLNRDMGQGNTAVELTSIKNNVTAGAFTDLWREYRREVDGRSCDSLRVTKKDISVEVKRKFDQQEKVYSERNDTTGRNSAPLYIMDLPNNSSNGPPEYWVDCIVDAAVRCCSLATNGG